MKILHLLEQQLTTKTLSDNDTLQDACDLINEGGQLSWTLTPDRLKSKLGGSGMIIGLYSGEYLIGTIGLKETTINGITGAEVGYLYIDPDHRSFQAYSMLYNSIKNVASQYLYIFATTVTTNKTINTLMERNNYVRFGFKEKSPFSSNILNYWIVLGTKFEYKETLEHLSEQFITESTENDFKVLVKNIHSAPAQFQGYIKKLVERSPWFEYGDENVDDSVLLDFGRRSLPSEPNTIAVGNKFYNKKVQYRMLKDVVPVVPTFSDSSDITGGFIAKKISGQRQEGQLVNIEPENPEEYIFQPLLDIVSEYRVVVYYMNGRYWVSGVYKKTGSNMSFTNITSGTIYNACKGIALSSVETLGYGVSGVDIAMSKTEISENVGAMISAMGKLSGKFHGDQIKGQLYFLEANTMPSLSNPMILHDFIQSIKSNMK